MQMPTHLITGVFIDKVISNMAIFTKSRKILTILVSLFSHGLLDALSRSTYHPPDPLPQDKFWVTYHKLILPSITIAILAKFWKKHKLAMTFSILPDIDWIIRDVNSRGNNPLPIWDKPILNSSLLNLINSLPLFNWIRLLPDWRYKKSTILLEGGIIALFLLAIKLIGPRGE